MAPLTAKPSAPSKRKIKVLIVDDHQLIREGLKALIQAQKDFVVCAEAADGPSALHQLTSEKPDIATVDIGLPGMSGLELIKNMAAKRPKLPILVISVCEESVYAERALHAGARGYLMKKESADHVIPALRRILEGKIYLSQLLTDEVMDHVVTGKPHAGVVDILSDRELEVFALIGKGYKSAKIADELNLGVKTVESYREQIKIKLHLEHSSDLTEYAVEWTHSDKPLFPSRG